VKLIGSPLKLRDTPAVVAKPPPMLGQHTDEILREYLGLDTAQIEAFRQSGIVN
jgi:formyl-CoA transferase